MKFAALFILASCLYLVAADEGQPVGVTERDPTPAPFKPDVDDETFTDGRNPDDVLTVITEDSRDKTSPSGVHTETVFVTVGDSSKEPTSRPTEGPKSTTEGTTATGSDASTVTEEPTTSGPVTTGGPTEEPTDKTTTHENPTTTAAPKSSKLGGWWVALIFIVVFAVVGGVGFIGYKKYQQNQERSRLLNP